ncbi:MAG TPA: hypothetical protein VMF90_12330 [Rhizobiaceae bacterium]|nr:hypothetical protein [Rhizobiaceae bacterium]
MIKTGDIKLDPSGTETSDLVCPNCGGTYLHQGAITVYDRGEDQKTETVTVVDGGTVQMEVKPHDPLNNPSRRRWGMTVAFKCEACPEEIDLRLNIAQHKGNTEISWRYNPV